MNTNLTEARPRGYPLEVHIDTELPSLSPLSSPVSIVTVCLNVLEDGGGSGSHCSGGSGAHTWHVFAPWESGHN